MWLPTHTLWNKHTPPTYPPTHPHTQKRIDLKFYFKTFSIPSPSSLAQRTTRTYLTSGIKIKVYRTSDNAPITSSFPLIGDLLNITLKVYNGLVPTSPKTTPRVWKASVILFPTLKSCNYIYITKTISTGHTVSAYAKEVNYIIINPFLLHKSTRSQQTCTNKIINFLPTKYIYISSEKGRVEYKKLYAQIHIWPPVKANYWSSIEILNFVTCIILSFIHL